MFRKLSFYATVFLALLPIYASAEVIGLVALDHYECKSYDHIVIETTRGYTLAEVYAGYSDTIEGHYISGDLHSYGFTDIYKEREEVGRLYIEDYMVGRSRALEWCYKD